MTDTQALVERLRNPPFGTETSERLLMGQAANALERLTGERAAIVAYLHEQAEECGRSANAAAEGSWDRRGRLIEQSAIRSLATAIEQGLHHRAQALADLAEGDAELIGDPKAG